MDGPDLSHLLDDANSERPSKDVLDGIIRRRRRLQARRARTAATLGLVIALAGAGVGIGLSRRGGTTLSALPRQPTHAPSISKNMSTMAPVAASPGSAPEGLGWVSSGSGAPTSTRVPTPPGEATSGREISGRLQATSALSASGSSLCSSWNCSLYSAYASTGKVRLQRLITRTSDGVSVRAFTAMWATAPFELVPTSSGSTATESGSSVPKLPAATVVHELCGHPGPRGRGVRRWCGRRRHRAARAVAAHRPINVLSDQVIGVAERSPIAVVVAHVTAQTVSVRAGFSGGSKDEMTVVDQWAVLVHKLATTKAGGTGSQGSASPGQATVYALSGTGTGLEQAELPGSGSLAMAVEACPDPAGGTQEVPGSSSSGSPGSTSSASTGSPSSQAPAASAKPTGG